MKNNNYWKFMHAIAAIAVGTAVVSCSDQGKEQDENHEASAQEAHHDHAGMIKLDDHEASAFGVKTEKTERGDFSEVILVGGQIESKATDEAMVAATRSGILTLNPTTTTGQPVKASSAIGSISQTRVEGGNATAQAKAARDAAKRELDRLTPLHADGVVSTRQYNEALTAFEQAETALRSSGQGSGAVVAPKTGVITQLLARDGEYVEAGQGIAVVSANTNLTLRADVPEKYAQQVSRITTANFRPASSDTTISLQELGGKKISSNGRSEGGYIPLYFSFSNNGSAAPGAFAEVYLIAEPRRDVLSVPLEAIVEINGNKCVYTLHGEGLYEKHVVTTGSIDGKRVEILSGLESGSDVVTHGAQVIRMAETSATAIPGHSHSH